MSQRINKLETIPRTTDGDGNPQVLRFEKFKSLTRTKGGHVDIYEARCGEQFFGYLYVTSDRYSLVWGNSSFEFEMPYMLMEFQFSNKETWRIIQLSPTLPFRKEKIDFYYQRATAGVFLHGEDGAREFEMLDERPDTKYTTELIEGSDATSRIAFARYDSVIVYGGELHRICFTAERLNQEANDGWELVVNMPRRIVLEGRTLGWAVANHESRESMGIMDCDKSSAELSKILSQ